VIAGRPIEIPGIKVSASPSDRASDNEKWKEELKSLKDELKSLGDKLLKEQGRPLDTLIQPAWDRWGLRIANYLSGRSKADLGVSYEDLLLAAADLPPSNLFRGDIGSMTPADWTRLCLRGAKGAQRDAGAESTPGWTCSFALVALGFGPDIVRGVEADLRPVRDSESLPSSFAERSSAPNVTGRLIIVLDLSQPATASRASARPYLVVDLDLLASCDGALAWLADHGVFDEVIGESSKPVTELLGDDLKKMNLRKKGFVRRPPETYEESLRDDIFFGVKNIDDLLERADRQAEKLGG